MVFPKAFNASCQSKCFKLLVCSVLLAETGHFNSNLSTLTHLLANSVKLFLLCVAQSLTLLRYQDPCCVDSKFFLNTVIIYGT